MKIDTDLVAGVLAHCEAHCDDPQDEELLAWITDHVGDAIEKAHPRFDRSEWDRKAAPILHKVVDEDVRQVLLQAKGV